MEREILPWLAARCRRVLFVGAAPYTHHYERLFRPGQYTTIDVHSSTAVWGSRDHIVGPIQDINRRRPKGSFDGIVLNGVFGFGVDKIEDMSVVLKELHDALEPQGFLVVGRNTNLHDDPRGDGSLPALIRAKSGSAADGKAEISGGNPRLRFQSPASGLVAPREGGEVDDLHDITGLARGVVWRSHQKRI